MATISPETLATELRFREKRQNYAGMLDSISLSKKETNAARNAAGGESVGATQAGLESMMQIYDNAVDVAESTAKTIIAKVAPTGHDLEAQLHPGMTDAEIASLDAIMKNAAVTVTEIFGPAIAAATASSKMNHKIIYRFKSRCCSHGIKKCYKDY